MRRGGALGDSRELLGVFAADVELAGRYAAHVAVRGLSSDEDASVDALSNSASDDEPPRCESGAGEVFCSDVGDDVYFAHFRFNPKERRTRGVTLDLLR